MSTFEVDPVEFVRGDLRLRLTGELDLRTAPDAFGIVINADLQPGAVVLIDCSQVTFIDSSGVNMLLKLKAYLDGMGCGLVVEDASAAVRRVLTVLGLSAAFGLDTDLSRS